jgi:hypothetical protein
MSNGETMTPTAKAPKDHKADHKVAHEAPKATPETAAAAADPVVHPHGTSSVAVLDTTVTVPVKFYAGMQINATEARILQAAVERQFMSNQTANANARAKKYAKAKNDAERALYAPLTAAQLGELFRDYMPSVGGAPRQSSVERMRHEATWRAIIAYLTEHNKSVEAGQPGIIAAAGGKGVAIPKVPTKTKGVTEEQHKANLEAFEAIKTTQIERFAANPKFAERIQIQLDALEAEKGSKKSEAAAVETVSVDALF